MSSSSGSESDPAGAGPSYWHQHPDRAADALRKAVNASDDVYFVKDHDHRLLLVSRSLAESLGLHSSDMEGHLDTEFWPLDVCEGDPENGVRGYHDQDREALAGQTTLVTEHVVLQDGVNHVFQTRRVPLRDASGEVYGVLGFAHDNTDSLLLGERTEELRATVEALEYRTRLEELEAQLRQSQRLESVGLLAGGIAHDFNNLLTVVLGCSELLARRFKNDATSENLTLCHDIQAAGRRAEKLTSQLLAFSRRQFLRPERVALGDVVEDMQRLLSRLIGEHIDLVTQVDDGVAPAEVDRGQLEQVITNLVVNARDAMPEGGELTLEARNAELSEADVRELPDVSPGAYTKLVVRDTGCGMDEVTLGSIFEPFYSTKPTGSGTGLGLSTVYGIVKQSGGHLTVASEQGQGTTFSVYLPRSERKPSPEDSALPAAESAATDQRTVLVVEDDTMVREAVIQMLASLGFDVVGANGLNQALEASRAHGGVVDLLVTDVVLPKSSGLVVAKMLREERPGLKVLYVSGYNDDAIAQRGALEQGSVFLQKPCTVENLEASIRTLFRGGLRS
jgi:PAS domain S-box-containing protein